MAAGGAARDSTRHGSESRGGGERGRTLTEEMVFMRTKCNRMELIKHLNLWGNDLQNISVIRQMTNLEVLSLSVNRVGSLNALRGCPKLRELYLRKNDIRDLAEVQCLANLQNLRVLWLNENPCATLPHYRMYVLQRLPGLGKLDSQEVTADELRHAQQADLADAPTCADMDFEESPRDEGYPAPETLDEPHGGPLQHGGGRRSFAVANEALSAQEADATPGERRDGHASRGSRHSSSSFHLYDSSPVGPYSHGVAASAQPLAAQHRNGNGRAPLPGDAAGLRGVPAHEEEADSASEERHSSESERWAARQGRSRYLDYGDECDRPDHMPDRVPQAWQSPDTTPIQARRNGNDERDSGGRQQRGSRGAPGNEAARMDLRQSRGSGAGGGGTPSGLPGHAGSAARADNVLCAVLALVKELDPQGLELVRRAVEQRLCEA